MTTTPTDDPALVYLKRRQLCERVDLSYPTICKLMREDGFPRGLDIGGMKRWIAAEVDEWMRSRPRQRLLGDPDHDATLAQARGRLGGTTRAHNIRKVRLVPGKLRAGR